MTYGSYERNPYSHPENQGITIVHEIDDPYASYSFHIFCLWRRTEDGKLFYASDSGCSCPAPFEDYCAEGQADLTELTPDTWQAFEKEVLSWEHHTYKADSEEVQMLRVEMLRKASKALR